MSEWMFRWLMQGKTIEEIVAHSADPKPTAEAVRESIINERKTFERRCLEQVLINARKGDVDAIDWLAKRGLFADVKYQD